MLNKWLVKFFGTKHQRDFKRKQDEIDVIRDLSDDFKTLSESELQKKTLDFKARIADGEGLEEILPEAFATVVTACRQLLGTKYIVCDIPVTWNMALYDVQIFGAMELFKGGISEMATGEGKTLVATLPLYTHALLGRGAHLVTVNDYLARRDAEWMGLVYNYLGLECGSILSNMEPPQRRKAYNADITYGTNNEFGFDFLRDNMAIRAEDKVQRDFYYAIVDEVDSVLVDEARTPLIISGPVSGGDSTRKYAEVKSKIERVVRKQRELVNRRVTEAEKLLEDDNEYEAGVKLLQVQRALPKNRRLLEILKEQGIKRLVNKVESDFMRDKNLHMLDEELFYTIDEKGHTINISDMGRDAIAGADSEMFVIPDLDGTFREIDEDKGLTSEEKTRKKGAAEAGFVEKSEKLHNINQLLKAYSLFEKDVDYVLQDGKVVIVDVFTGRLMAGRRFSEGLHSALEAKENVKIEGETQTMATITLQNYFRMYEILAGMTGTAETEAGEFWEIYKLGVSVVPTNEPVRRLDYEDIVFRTKREKFKAVLDEIEEQHGNGRPVLVGTVTVEVSEVLSRMLRRRGIPHEVLNAKHHQKEAEIVAGAGQPGRVTIATNMAGRGTDIKLGAGVVRCKKCGVLADQSDPGVADNLPEDWTVEDCVRNMPCGLHILGTERHESRRIDRQLRGRSGRQGDPGSSRFFLSLEDNLMRLFGSARIAGVMDRLGLEEGEVIEHSMVTKAIGRAQKKVEGHNFGIRKHLLEYDDVMNKQREVIYNLRSEALTGENLKESMLERLETVCAMIVDDQIDTSLEPDKWDLAPVSGRLGRLFLREPAFEYEDPSELTIDKLVDDAHEFAVDAYSRREEELSPEVMRDVERFVVLRMVDSMWKDHLYDMDQLKGGIGLRAYGQKDPLLEYKSEGFKLFTELLDKIDQEIISFLFRVRVAVRPEQRPPSPAMSAIHKGVDGYGGSAATAGEAKRQRAGWATSSPEGGRKKIAPVRVDKRPGRNDPCSCGSGKKYKKCCGIEQ